MLYILLKRNVLGNTVVPGVYLAGALIVVFANVIELRHEAVGRVSEHGDDVDGARVTVTVTLSLILLVL